MMIFYFCFGNFRNFCVEMSRHCCVEGDATTLSVFCSWNEAAVCPVLCALVFCHSKSYSANRKEPNQTCHVSIAKRQLDVSCMLVSQNGNLNHLDLKLKERVHVTTYALYCISSPTPDEYGFSTEAIHRKSCQTAKQQSWCTIILCSVYAETKLKPTNPI